MLSPPSHPHPQLETGHLEGRGREPQLDRQTEKQSRRRKLETETKRESEGEGEAARASEGARASGLGSQRRVWFDFIPCSHFSARFLTDSHPALTEFSPQGRFGRSPRLFPFILAVSSGGWGCWYPKPRDLPRSEQRRQQFVWDQGGGTPGAPRHPAKPPSLPAPPGKSGCPGGVDRSRTGCRTSSAAGVCWGRGGLSGIWGHISRCRGSWMPLERASGWAQRGEEFRCQSSNDSSQPSLDLPWKL